MDIPYTVKPRPDTGLYSAKLGIWLFLASEVMLFGALFSSYIVLRVNALDGNWPHGLLNIPIGTFNTAVLITSSVTVVLGWAALKMNNFAAYRKYQAVTILCALGFLGIKTFEYKEKFGHYEVWTKQPVKVHRNGAEVETTRLIGHFEVDGKHPLLWTQRTLAAKKIETLKFAPDPYHYTMTPKEMAEAKKHAHAHGDGHGHGEIEIPVSNIARLSAFVPNHGTFFAIYFTLTALHGLHVLGGALVIAWIWGPGAKMWKTNPEQYTNRVEISGLFWHFVDLVWIFLFPIIYLL